MFFFSYQLFRFYFNKKDKFVFLFNNNNTRKLIIEWDFLYKKVKKSFIVFKIKILFLVKIKFLSLCI